MSTRYTCSCLILLIQLSQKVKQPLHHWRHDPFPLYEDIADLVIGRHATGEGAISISTTPPNNSESAKAKEPSAEPSKDVIDLESTDDEQVSNNYLQFCSKLIIFNRNRYNLRVPFLFLLPQLHLCMHLEVASELLQQLQRTDLCEREAVDQLAHLQSERLLVLFVISLMLSQMRAHSLLVQVRCFHPAHQYVSLLL